MCLRNMVSVSSLWSLLHLEHSVSARSFSRQWLKRGVKSRQGMQTQHTFTGQLHHGGQCWLTRPLFHDPESAAAHSTCYIVSLQAEGLPPAGDDWDFSRCFFPRQEHAQVFAEYQRGHVVRRNKKREKKRERRVRSYTALQLVYEF